MSARNTVHCAKQTIPGYSAPTDTRKERIEVVRLVKEAAHRLSAAFFSPTAVSAPHESPRFRIGDSVFSEIVSKTNVLATATTRQTRSFFCSTPRQRNYKRF